MACAYGAKQLGVLNQQLPQLRNTIIIREWQSVLGFTCQRIRELIVLGEACDHRPKHVVCFVKKLVQCRILFTHWSRDWTWRQFAMNKMRTTQGLDSDNLHLVRRIHQTPHIDLPGDRGGDEGGAALVKEGDGLLGFRDQSIEALYKRVYIVSDCLLFGGRGQRHTDRSKKASAYSIPRTATTLTFHVPQIRF